MNTENQVQKHLDRLLTDKVPDEFGVSFIQRACTISYNNAMNVLDLGLREGKIVIGSEQWLYRVAPNVAGNQLADHKHDKE